MSRSTKKHNIGPVAKRGGKPGLQKSWKRQENHRIRAGEHATDLENGEVEVPRKSEWYSPKDGKREFYADFRGEHFTKEGKLCK